MAKKMKSRQSASQDYWERREKEALKQTRASEEEFAGKIGQVYKDMRKDINDRINRWYIRYANDSEIDITEAKKRVSKLDIEEYSELAKKYVALSRDEETRAQAFTDEANEQMKIYNLTMKVNRLENLKAQMGLDLCGGFSKLQKNYGEFLTDQMMQEFTRQSGILGMTTTNPRRFRRQMEAIVNGSFHNATFSQRLWNQQDALKGELDRLLTRALIQGLNPRTVAPELKKKFDSSEQAADLLMITELCRVQTEAQKLAFQEFSYEDYSFICNGGACKECEALNGKHFKVKDMQAGRNAPPMHPRCRCSTAAYMDREAFEKWLEGQNKVNKQIGTDLGAPDILGLGTSEKENNIREALANSLSKVTENLNQAKDRTYHKSLLAGIIDTSEYVYDPNTSAPLLYSREDDAFYFNYAIVNYLDTAESYVVTHDASHKLDYLYFKSWENQEFLDALNLCAEEAYLRKSEIEGWFKEDGKYYDNYAMADAFHALFYGNIQTTVGRVEENYYYIDETRLPAEVFADISSMLANDGCEEQLLKKAVDVIKKELI